MNAETAAQVEAQKKMKAKMEESLGQVFKKYGGMPSNPEEFSSFLADIYVAGATDALELVNG